VSPAHLNGDDLPVSVNTGIGAACAYDAAFGDGEGSERTL
jgi:hypothetical protein